MKNIVLQSVKTTGSTITYLGQENASEELHAGFNGPNQKIEQSIAYMMEHLNGPLNVATLAAQANVSPSHYFALFKRRTGCAPIDYFIRLRMRQACRLLDTTAMSVKEIAAALGYDDPFYFSRIFKSVNDVPPSDYRAMRRGGCDCSGDKASSVHAAAM